MIDDALRRLRPTVQRVAWRLIRRLPASVDLDDMVQVGMIAAAAAVQRYDPAGGASLETFVARRALGGMLDELRRADHLGRDMRRARRGMGDANPEQPWPVGFDPVDPAPGPLAELLERERAARLEAEIARLPDRPRAVLRLALDGELALHEIGSIFGVSGARAWQIAHDAAALIGRRLADPDVTTAPAPPPPRLEFGPGALVG